MKILFSAIIIFLAIWQPASAVTFSDVRNEQVSTLPITNGSTLLQQHVFSSCASHTNGQPVLILAQSEVTNPYGFNVGIGYLLRAWDYHVAENGASTFVATWDASPAVMTNVTPAKHHLVVHEAFAHKVTYQGNANTRCYTLVMWAVASGGGGNIIVEQGYGYLQTIGF